MHGLGVSLHNNKVWIYYHSPGSSNNASIAESSDGFEFEKTGSVLEIDPTDLLSVKISSLDKHDIISYERKAKRSTQAFFGEKRLPSKFGAGSIVDDYQWNKNNVAYFGGTCISVGTFKTTKRMKFVKTGVRGERIDVDFSLRTSQGIFVIYHTYIYIDNSPHLLIKGVFFDPEDPTQIIWETKNSLWSEPHLWRDKKATCLGCVYLEGKLISYWDIDKLGIFLIQFPVFNDHPAHEGYHYKLTKH